MPTRTGPKPCRRGEEGARLGTLGKELIRSLPEKTALVVGWMFERIFYRQGVEFAFITDGWCKFMATVRMTLKDKVLETVKSEPLSPVDVVNALQKDAYSKEIEIALSDLLEEGSIEFEYDGRLHAAV